MGIIYQAWSKDGGHAWSKEVARLEFTYETHGNFLLDRFGKSKGGGGGRNPEKAPLGMRLLFLYSIFCV